MSAHVLHRETTLPLPIEALFPFFERPENLAELTPPEMGFEILTPQPLEMRRGAVIDYTVGVLGTRLHWRTLISEYEPPYRFVDLQLKGPYAFWHHTHSFESVTDGTLMKDTVRYLLPFGPLGRLVNRMLVSRRLNRIFDYRERAIRRLLLERGDIAAVTAQ